jgi:flagellar hook protein FlgE
MMRALFSGVTGLKSHQTRMDVIGNNISNVNTLGFKKSSVTFADLYSDTISSASAPSGTSGGTNAKQVGLGVAVSSVVINHTPGAASYTGNALDLTIDGDGFFIVKTADGNKYTRSGNFNLSSSGSLVDAGGNYVQCYNSVWKEGDAGTATSTGIDDESSTYFENFAYTPAAATVKTMDSGTYTFELDETTGNLKVYKDIVDITPAAGINLSTALSPAVTDTGALTAGTTYTLTIPDLGTITFEGSTSIAAGSGNSRFSDIASVLENAAIEVNNNDGFVPGTTVGNMSIDQSKYFNVSINEEGAIVAQLLNQTTDPIAGTGTLAAGTNVVLGYVSLASFSNTAGLEKVGENMYEETPNSGRASVSVAGTGGTGSLTPSSLEMSNVDLSEEMVNMIITQRGFQANSRIITSTDSMLEELVNLKR